MKTIVRFMLIIALPLILGCSDQETDDSYLSSQRQDEYSSLVLQNLMISRDKSFLLVEYNHQSINGEERVFWSISAAKSRQLMRYNSFSFGEERQLFEMPGGQNLVDEYILAPRLAEFIKTHGYFFLPDTFIPSTERRGLGRRTDNSYYSFEVLLLSIEQKLRVPNVAAHHQKLKTLKNHLRTIDRLAEHRVRAEILENFITTRQHFTAENREWIGPNLAADISNLIFDLRTDRMFHDMWRLEITGARHFR